MGSTGSQHYGDDAGTAIDPYAVFEALTGRKIDRRSVSSNTLSDRFDDLVHIEHDSGSVGVEPSPDPQPEDVHVGVINPYALIETMIGHQLDTQSLQTTNILSSILQTDYDELFDLRHNSMLFAGLKLDQAKRRSEPLSQKDIKILSEKDLVTPDLSTVQKLDDLQKVGLKDLGQTRVKMARIQNGKLRLVLDAQIGRKTTNSEVTPSLSELTLPFRDRREGQNIPNSSWRDAYEASDERFPRGLITENRNTTTTRGNFPFQGENRFDNPIQGALTNSWLIAALFSVFWAEPSVIKRGTRPTRNQEEQREEKQRVLSIKFFDKGGRNNAKTTTVDVNYEIPVNNSTSQPVYCHSSDGNAIWPSLYEKAFAKWITGSSSNRPDITQTHNGDPVKAMAQINGKKPHYYFTDKHQATELVGLVRSNSVNLQTIVPMTAWTYATGPAYRGGNMVANHAYSVLGWASQGSKQYIILRNPWGVTEPIGLTSYPGLIDKVEREFWHPAVLLDAGGVMALEASAFKEFFACLGVAK